MFPEKQIKYRGNLNPTELKNRQFDNEELMQAAAMDLIHNYFPEFKDKAFHPKNEQHIPKFINESPRDYEKRAAMIGNNNKRKGKLAGVPDIIIRHKGVMFGIELKLAKHEGTKSGGLEPEQVQIHLAWSLDNEDLPVIVCYHLLALYHTLCWILTAGFRVIREGGASQE